MPGYKKPLEADKSKTFDHPYEGAIAEAKGVSKKTGVHQQVRVIVLERKGVAVVTAVIAENAERTSASAEAKQAEQVIKTLRTRPPS